jgi:conjugal transfer pilus assembly protein TraV
VLQRPVIGPAAALLLLVATLTGCASTGSAPDVPAGETRAMATPPVLPQPEGPAPIREPAMVMRVWVAPWENANGDLNAPGYVFTEIQPRRWTLGTEADPAQGRVITPLQIEERQAPAAQTPAMPSLPRDMGARPGDRPTQGFFSS